MAFARRSRIGWAKCGPKRLETSYALALGGKAPGSSGPCRRSCPEWHPEILLRSLRTALRLCALVVYYTPSE